MIDLTFEVDVRRFVSHAGTLRRGYHGRMYHKKTYGDYKQAIRQAAIQALSDEAATPIKDAFYRVDIRAQHRKRARDRVPVIALTRRGPDPDNLAKGVLDSLEGVMFENDSQVAELRVRREQSGLNVNRLTIRVREVLERSDLGGFAGML